MTIERPHFPPVIDSSMRSEFLACPTSFERRYLRGYQRAGKSIHLHFGAAFAAGLADYRIALWRDHVSVDEALAHGIQTIIEYWGDYDRMPPEGGPGSTKTLERCCGALEAHAAQYPPMTDHVQPLIQADGTPAVEFNGALPLPIMHPETGEPLLYSGRFDMLARMGDSLYVVDDKTATQLGPSWPNNWTLRAQFTGYCYIAREFGYDAQGAIIRGISILKNGYGHAEVIKARPRFMIDAWYAQLLRDVRRMIASWQSGEWDLNLDKACADYGGCQFVDVCNSPNPQTWLDNGDFEHVAYDPLGEPG